MAISDGIIKVFSDMRVSAQVLNTRRGEEVQEGGTPLPKRGQEEQHT